MDLKDFLAISGKPGLFRYISQAKNGIIVESLTDGRRMPAFASEKVSALDDIAIFTTGEDVKLSLVFDRIFEKENGGPAIDPKSEPVALTAYFEKVLPEYDRERVYPSDIKKVLSWYNQLHTLGLLKASETEKPAEEAPVVVEEEKKPKPKAGKKPATSKKSATPKT